MKQTKNTKQLYQGFHPWLFTAAPPGPNEATEIG